MVTDLPGPGSELETTGCILQLLVKIPNAFSLNWTIYDNGEENSDFYNAIKVTPDRARLAIAFISSSLCPGLLKYLINRHNCDTISNEPFIEPHFYNLEKLGTTDSELGAASPDPPSRPNGASNTLTGAIKYPEPDFLQFNCRPARHRESGLSRPCAGILPSDPRDAVCRPPGKPSAGVSPASDPAQDPARKQV